MQNNKCPLAIVGCWQRGLAWPGLVPALRAGYMQARDGVVGGGRRPWGCRGLSFSFSLNPHKSEWPGASEQSGAARGRLPALPGPAGWNGTEAPLSLCVYVLFSSPSSLVFSCALSFELFAKENSRFNLNSDARHTAVRSSLSLALPRTLPPYRCPGGGGGVAV